MSDEAQKVDAWMPLWIGAYMADTMTLTTQQHGAYLLLLFAYWRNRGPLVDDDEDLAAITKASPADWRKLRAKLTRFFDVADGKWVHGRADKELTTAGLRKANASSKAKAAADARWGKSKKQSTKHAPSMPDALHEDCPTPPPSSLRSETIDDRPDGPPSAREVRPSVAVSIALRKAGIQANSDHPRLLALCEAGATVAEFVALLPTTEGKDKPFAYLLAAVEGERKRAASTAGQLHRGPMPNKQEAQEQRNRTVADKWAAQESA